MAAQWLQEVFDGDPSVNIFVDVDIPGANANADCVVVKGNKIVVVDAKVWKPAFYWSSFWRSDPVVHQGANLKPYAPATSYKRDAAGNPIAGSAYTNKTVTMAVDKYREALRTQGKGIEVQGAYLFIPPQHGKPSDMLHMKTWACSLQGHTKLNSARKADRARMKQLAGRDTDDQNAVLLFFQQHVRTTRK